MSVLNLRSLSVELNKGQIEGFSDQEKCGRMEDGYACDSNDLAN